MLLELVAIVSFLVVFYICFKIVTKTPEDADNAFIEEVFNSSKIPCPENDMNLYDAAREECYKVWMAVQKGWIPANVDGQASPTLPPVPLPIRLSPLTKDQLDQIEKEFKMSHFVKGDWIKECGHNEAKILKTTLFNRAGANIDRYEKTREDMFGKFELFKKQLLSDRQWKIATDGNQDMLEEIEFVRKEASLMEPGWGESIFAHAYKMREQQKPKETPTSINSRMNKRR